MLVSDMGPNVFTASTTFGVRDSRHATIGAKKRSICEASLNHSALMTA